MNKNHIIISAVIILAAIGTFAFINGNSSDNLAPLNFSASFLEDGGGDRDVVIKVDGEEITRAEFQIQADRTKQVLIAQGQGDLSNDNFQNRVKRQTINQMIAEILLLHEAEAKGFLVSPAEIETQYQWVLQQIGGEEQLLQRLEEISSSKENLRKDIKNQILIQKYVNKLVEEENIAVSDEEVGVFYAQLKTQQENISELSEIKSQIKSHLLQQKTSQFLSSLVNELRSEADIKISI